MWFKKDSAKELQKKYECMMSEAMQLQRNGKIPEYAKKTAQANLVLDELKALECAAV